MSDTGDSETVSDSSQFPASLPADDVTDTDSGVTSKASDCLTQEPSGSGTDIDDEGVLQSPIEDASRPAANSTDPQTCQVDPATEAVALSDAIAEEVQKSQEICCENMGNPDDTSSPSPEVQTEHCEENQPSTEGSENVNSAVDTPSSPPEVQTDQCEENQQSTEDCDNVSNADDTSCAPSELQIEHCELEKAKTPPSTEGSEITHNPDEVLSPPQPQTPRDGEAEGTKTSSQEDCENVKVMAGPDERLHPQQNACSHGEAEPVDTAKLCANLPENCENTNSPDAPLSDHHPDSSSRREEVEMKPPPSDVGDCTNNVEVAGKTRRPPGFRTDVSLLVTGVDVTVDRDVLQLYFEHPTRSGGGTALHFLDRLRKGYVIISFRDPQVVSRILDGRCHCLQGRSLTVSRSCFPYPSAGTAAVLVQGGPVVSKEMALEYYFDNPINGGGKIEDIFVDGDLQIAWITFAEAAVAAEVARRPHTVCGSPVTVTATHGVTAGDGPETGGGHDVTSGGRDVVSVSTSAGEHAANASQNPGGETRRRAVSDDVLAAASRRDSPRTGNAAREQDSRHLSVLPPASRLAQPSIPSSLAGSNLSVANRSSTTSIPGDLDSQLGQSRASNIDQEDEPADQYFRDISRSSSRQRLMSSSSEQENYGTGSEATVAVRGLKRSTSRDAIRHYFDNQRQSGGGEVTHVYLSSAAEGTAFVTFRHVKDAERVKAREGHELEDEALSVVDVVKNQLLLGDLPHCLNEDLCHFVQAKTGCTVHTVKFGHDGSVAVVTFYHDIDLHQVRDVLRSHSLHDKTLLVEPVALTNTVLVRDLPAASNSKQLKEQLTNLFSSRLGNLDMDIKVAEGNEYALVSFADPTVASNVVNTEDPYMFRSRELSISLYNESLGPSSGLREQPLAVPEPLQITDSDKIWKVSMLAKHPAPMSRLKGVLEKNHARLHESTNFDAELDGRHGVQIVCTLTEDVEDAHCLAASWSQGVLKALNEHLDKRFYHRSAPHNTAAYCNARRQAEDVKDSVYVICDSVNEKVHVFCDCERNRGTVDDIVTEALAENKKLTETKTTVHVKQHKGILSMLKAHDVGKEIQQKFPNLSVLFDLEIGSLELTGSDVEVGLMLSDFTKASQVIFTEVHYWSSPAVGLLLSSPEAQKAVEAACKGSDHEGEVDFSDRGFQTHSFIQEMAEQMIRSGQNAVTEKVIKLEDEGSKAAVKTPEWESLRDSAEKESEGTLRIVENESSVTMVAVGSSTSERFRVVEEFIHARRTVKRTVSLRASLSSLLQATLRQKYNDNVLRVDDFSVQGRDVVIEGNMAGVDAAEEYVKELENEAPSSE